MVRRCTVRGNPLVWADTSCNASKKMHKQHLKVQQCSIHNDSESATHLSATEQLRLRDETRKKLQSHHLLNIVTTGVCATSEAHGAVTVKELLEERTARKPHPTACVYAKICIQQQFIEYLQQLEEKAVRASPGWTLGQEDPRCYFKWQALSCQNSP